MFGLSRKMVENEPLKIFMALTDIERNRAKPLETNTVEILVRNYKALGSQYPLFAETPAISDATILAYLDAARGITQIRDIGLRADAAGTMQALAGFWQIFVRQRSIQPADADSALSAVLQGFAKIQSQRDVFDAGQKGVGKLLAAAHAPASGSPQDHMMDLLAGTKAAGEGALSDAHTQMIQDMTRVFEAQRLVSLDTIFTLADRLEAAAAGQKLDNATVIRLAGRITEIQLPRTALSTQRPDRGLDRLLDRQTHRSRTQTESALGDRQGRRRSAKAAGHSCARWRRCCATPWWDSIMSTTLLPERRCCSRIRPSCAATISSATRRIQPPGWPPRFWAAAGPPMPGDV